MKRHPPLGREDPNGVPRLRQRPCGAALRAAAPSHLGVSLQGVAGDEHSERLSGVIRPVPECAERYEDGQGERQVAEDGKKLARTVPQ